MIMSGGSGLKRRSGHILGDLGLITVLIAGVCSDAGAQDSHYWTNQYGPRSVLLGGSVIGSVNDLSSIYYNPGALGLIEDPELVLAAKVWQFSNIIIDGLTSSDNKLSSPRVDEAPGYFAGLLPFKFLGANRLAYSIFTRRRLKLQTSQAATGTTDVLGIATGDEQLFGEVAFGDNLSEDWVGLTWSKQSGKKWGFGVSGFVAYRSQDVTSQVILEAVAPSDTAGIFLNQKDTGYWTARGIIKGGVQYLKGNLKTGLSLTTPSLPIVGSGSVLTNDVLIVQATDSTGAPVTFLEADTQSGLSATYKSPLSIGAGAGYTLGNTDINFSLEWFNAVSSYNVMEPEPFIGQSTGDTVQTVVEDVASSVINFGIGVSQLMSEKFRIYGSFATDFSTQSPETNSDIAKTDWDIFHFFGGADFTFLKSEFTAGLGFSFGSTANDRGVSLPDNPDDGILGTPSPAQFTYRSAKLLVGFSFNL